MIRVFFGVPGSYGNTGEEVYGPYWALGERERQAAPPPPQGLVQIGLGGGAAPPPSFSSLFPFLDSYSYYLEGGNPTPGGSRTPPRARHREGQPSPSSTPLYTGRGAPLGDTTIVPLDLLAVCGAPSIIIHLGHTVAVLRRSPASVEHHHRHHAVVLTELSLKARLDQSSRDVIELNVC